jgi:hypothetical protein
MGSRCGHDRRATSAGCLTRPGWALMVIALDILIIWALASYLRQPAPVAPQDIQPAPRETQATMS